MTTLDPKPHKNLSSGLFDTHLLFEDRVSHCVIRTVIQIKGEGTSPTMKNISPGVVQAIPYWTTLSIPKPERVLRVLYRKPTSVDTMNKIRNSGEDEVVSIIPSLFQNEFAACERDEHASI